MDTIGKMYRYLAIHEAYKEVAEHYGDAMRGLSMDFIYGEIEKRMQHRNLYASRKTILRALCSPVLTAEQIERMR